MAEGRQPPFIAARDGHVIIMNREGHYYVTSEAEDHTWSYTFPAFTKRWEAQPAEKHIRASHQLWGAPGYKLSLVEAACLIAWADFQLTPEAHKGKGLLNHVNTAARRFRTLQAVAAHDSQEALAVVPEAVVLPFGATVRNFKAEQRALTLDALDHGEAWMWPIAKLVMGHMDLADYYPKFEPGGDYG